jgi:transcriptional regulator with XRE-family HTH domain
MKITNEQIRKAREALGLSQNDFASKLGLTGSAVSLMETGQTSPISVDEDSSEYLAWRALLTGDRAKIAQLPSPFAAWLRATRMQKKMTPEALAELSKMTKYSLGCLERAQDQPTPGIIRRLEDALGTKYPAPQLTPADSNSSPIAGVGNLKDFDPHIVDERPLCAGIYVLYDISERPIYVGESKNIRQRLKQHEEKFWFKRPLVEFAAYIEVENDAMRKGIEQILINFLRSNAVLNRQHVIKSH